MISLQPLRGQLLLRKERGPERDGPKNVDDLFTHSERKVKPGAVGRTNDDISAGAPGSRRQIAQHAAAESDQREDHRDLHANRDDTQQSAHRTVL